MHHVWDAAVRKRDARILLCVGCLEMRLGRRLHRDDFANVPLNREPERPRSARLIERMQAEPPAVSGGDVAAPTSTRATPYT
jgi:hypothetical protein